MKDNEAQLCSCCKNWPVADDLTFLCMYCYTDGEKRPNKRALEIKNKGIKNNKKGVMLF